jgi:hypothetical protein
MQIGMHATNHSTRVLLFGALALLLSYAIAHAQTSAGLLLKPWPTDQVLDSTTDGYVLNASHSDAGQSLQVSDSESCGRLRLQPGNPASPRLGYDFHFLDTNAKSGIIPRELTDLSIAVGSAIGEYHGWIAGMTVGVGYAGDAAFSRGSAWYGKASFDLGKQVSDQGIVALILDYDGNRPYFPDIPLPGVVYRHHFDDTLCLSLGLPYSCIVWNPIDKVTFEASYRLASKFTAQVGYEFVENVSLFGSYHYVQEAYHIDGLGSRQRLLFSDQRVEAGVEYTPNTRFSFRLAAGYAFDNRFDRGFGFENPHGLVSFGDTPYVRVTFELKI